MHILGHLIVRLSSSEIPLTTPGIIAHLQEGYIIAPEAPLGAIIAAPAITHLGLQQH
jgi:hypothetical protein